MLASLDEVSGIIGVDEVSSCSDLLKSYTHTWIEQKGLRCMSILFLDASKVMVINLLKYDVLNDV